MKWIIAGLLVLVGTTILFTVSETKPCVASITMPVYPHIARMVRMTGTVDLKVEVQADGRVGRVEVLGISTNAQPKQGETWLTTAATENLREWSFEPARLADSPLRVLTVRYVFRLEGKPEEDPETRVNMRLPSYVEVISRPPPVIVD